MPRHLRWSTIRKNNIDEWTSQQQAEGLASATIKQRMATLRTFFAWLVHEGMLHENPARFCQTPKRQEKLPRQADPQTIDAWLQRPARTAEERAVNILTAIITETGLRVSEALALRKSDMHDGRIIVRGKGSRERVVFYGRRTRTAIENYAPMGDILFPTWSAEGIRWAMYRTLGKFASHVHPHQLRHTFAMESLNNGMALDEVSQLLGHKHVTTTQIYARAATRTLEEHYKQTH